MKAIKILGIIGIVLSVFCYLSISMLLVEYENEAATGWGVIAVLYLLAYSIVGVVSKENK